MGNCCSETITHNGKQVFLSNEFTSGHPIPISLSIPQASGLAAIDPSNVPADATLVRKIPDVYTSELKRPVVELGKFDYEPYNRPDIHDLPVLGPYLYNKGGVYFGQYRNGLRHGQGLQIWPDGSYYEGYWENDLVNGIGRLVASEGDVYEGQWLNGKTNGKGVYYHTNGAKYDGEWRDDMQEGFGVETLPYVLKYEGQYYRGLKEGMGVFYWGSTVSWTHLTLLTTSTVED